MTTVQRFRVREVTVSYSELRAFRSCRQRYRFRHEWGFERNAPEAALSIGTVMHRAIRAAYREAMREDEADLRLRASVASDRALEDEIGEWRAAVEQFGTDEDRADFADHEETARYVTRAYLDTFFERDVAEFRVIAVEQPFRVPLRGEGGKDSRVILEGEIDILFERRSDGALKLRDHKSTSGGAHTYDSRFSVDAQLPLYLYGLRRFFPDRRFLGAEYGVIAKKGPRAPKILADGRTVSSAKIDTLRHVYAQALEVQRSRWGIEPSPKQRALLATLPTDPRRYASLHSHVYTDAEIDRAAREAYADALVIRQHTYKHALPVSRNSAACEVYGCAYTLPCGEPDESAQRAIFAGPAWRHAPRIRIDPWRLDDPSRPWIATRWTQLALDPPTE